MGWALRCDAEFGRDCSLRGILASGDVDLAIVLALVLRYDLLLAIPNPASQQVLMGNDLLHGFNTAE